MSCALSYAEALRTVRVYLSKRAPWQDVDDLAQETLLRAYKAPSQPRTHVKGWVCRLAAGVLHDYYDRRRLEARLRKQVASVAESSYFDPLPAERPEIWPRLNPTQRCVVKLLTCGLSNEEIAGQLQIQPRSLNRHAWHMRKLAGETHARAA